MRLDAQSIFTDSKEINEVSTLSCGLNLGNHLDR